MGSRFKEDERNEKIIRGLLKREDNKKCINCGALGPQYVCTNFAIFICMTCSGIHREFTHRVKSISMSKFSAEEVAALQSGGNQRAWEIFYKNWDPQRHPLPDSRQPEKLRSFIKAVYVDRLFSGDNTPNDLKQRSSLLRSSLSFEERQQHGGSPRLSLPHQRTRSEDRSSSIRDYSPPVLSMREILGDDLPPLRIESSRVQPKEVSDHVPPTDHQRSSQISRFGSFVGSSSSPPQATYKRANSESHIDFDPAKSTSAAEFLAQQPYIKADTTGWATFDSAPSSTIPNEPQRAPEPVPQAFPQTMQQMPYEPWSFQYTRPFPPNIYVPGAPGVLPFVNQPPYIPQAFVTVPQAIPRPPKTRNPFDLPDEASFNIPQPPPFAFPQQVIPSSSASIPELDQQWSQVPHEPGSGGLTFANSPKMSRPGNPFC